MLLPREKFIRLHTIGNTSIAAPSTNQTTNWSYTYGTPSSLLNLEAAGLLNTLLPEDYLYDVKVTVSDSLLNKHTVPINIVQYDCVARKDMDATDESSWSTASGAYQYAGANTIIGGTGSGLTLDNLTGFSPRYLPAFHTYWKIVRMKKFRIKAGGSKVVKLPPTRFRGYRRTLAVQNTPAQATSSLAAKKGVTRSTMFLATSDLLWDTTASPHVASLVPVTVGAIGIVHYRWRVTNPNLINPKTAVYVNNLIVNGDTLQQLVCPPYAAAAGTTLVTQS